MKKYFLLLSVTLVFSGCGVEWFPSNSSTTTGSPSLNMTINPSTIAVGASTALTFTIINAAGTAQTGLGFTDTLPTGLTVLLTPTASQCGGTVTSPSSTTLSFTGGALAAGTTSCTVTAAINGTTAGSYSLTSALITGLTGGLVNNSTTQSLTVSAVSTSPTLSMLISSNPATSNVATTFTFTITNSSGNPAQSVLAFTENLPAGLTASGGTGTCGGTVSAAGQLISLSGGAIASGATSCTVTASVTGTNVGSPFTIPSSTGLSVGLVNGTTSQTLTVN